MHFIHLVTTVYVVLKLHFKTKKLHIFKSVEMHNRTKVQVFEMRSDVITAWTAVQAVV